MLGSFTTSLLRRHVSRCADYTAGLSSGDITFLSCTKKADMPTPRWGLSSSVVDGKLYAMGGAKGHPDSPLTTLEEYDPTTDTWRTKSPMPTARIHLSTCEVNGKIYAIDGSTKAAPCNPALAIVEEYDPYPLIVDFNGDGIVDADDICLMLEHWLTDELFYDIAPRPFGDGIVDTQDLILLAEHLFEEFPSVEPIE